jgi:hypothetical protein
MSAINKTALAGPAGTHRTSPRTLSGSKGQTWPNNRSWRLPLTFPLLDDLISRIVSSSSNSRCVITSRGMGTTFFRHWLTGCGSPGFYFVLSPSRVKTR